MLINQSLKEFNGTVASEAPAPGGGSVAALAGALAASLAVMVCNLTIGREKFMEVEEELKGVREQAQGLQAELQELVDVDTASFNQVMSAYKLPKDSEADRAKRSEAIQRANQQAARIPLNTAGCCMEVLKLARLLLEKGNPNALTDVGVAAQMAESGLKGAVYNVLINLGSIKDQDFVQGARNSCEGYLSQSQTIIGQVEDILQAKL